MGWLDKGFKNIVKGAKNIATSPEGILLLSAAAPWLAPKMAPWLKTLGGTGKLGKFASSALKSPWIKNALTNAAMQGGIATLTGSKHPWKAMGYSALASMPFTALQSAQAANAYNKLYKTSDQWNALSEAAQGKGEGLRSWYDFALGNDLPSLTETVTKAGDFAHMPRSPVDMPVELIPRGSGLTPTVPSAGSGSQLDILNEIAGSKGLVGESALSKKLAAASTDAPSLTRGLISKTKDINLDDVSNMASSYFTKEPGGAKEGWAGLLSDVIGPVDMPAAIIPAITGMYAGRMTEEEKWLQKKDADIRMWAHQHGIPYEEAREIWKDGYRNPYYTTRTPDQYNFQFNKGGSVPYKDDYTAGGSAVGPGTGTSDSIRPVALSDGEFVFTEEATNNFPGGHEGLYSLMNSLDPNSERPEEARV